jgi:hypothetical protein
MDVKKFSEFEVINESIQPYYTLSKSQLNQLVFTVLENAKNKEEVWNIIDEQIKIFEEERKIPTNCPPGAFM